MKWYSEFLVGTWGDYLCTVYLFVNGGRRLYRGVLTYNGKVLYKATRSTLDLIYDNLNIVGALLDKERRDNIYGDEELELVTKELLDKYGTLPKYLW